MAKPMSVETLRRLMAERSPAAYLAQRRAERRFGASRLSIAIALVIARRADGDWGWLDQDRAFHQP